jgi:hypothetical protein
MIRLHRLRSVLYLERLSRRLFLRFDDQNMRVVLMKIFEELKEIHRVRGSTYVAVYLPAQMDSSPTKLDDFRAYLAEELARRDIPFIDLVPDLRALSAAERKKLFLSGTKSPFLGADGHYTVKGNIFIASLIQKKLRSLPDANRFFLDEPQASHQTPEHQSPDVVASRLSSVVGN